MAERTGGVSRRTVLKYLLGVVVAAISARIGYQILTRPRESAVRPEASPEISELPAGEYADLILLNGKILTVDPEDSIVDAVAVKDGTIVATGSYHALEQLRGPTTVEVDLKGKTVTPGFVDSHLHMHYYGKQFQDKLIDIRFPAVKTREDLIEKVTAKVATASKGEWIAGNQGFIFIDPPNRWELDELSPENPVYLLHSSGQFAVANSLALSMAGITKDSPNPYSAVIAKDAATGEPTGFLYHYPAIDLVRILVPGIGVLTDEEQRGFILKGAEKCFEAGYTSIQDVIIATPQHVKLYIDLAREGNLPINVYMLLYVQSLEEARAKLGLADHLKGDHYNFAGWKLAVDGGAGAGTLLMYDQKVPMSQNSYPYHSQETLNEMVFMFHQQGYQVAFHVGGDRAIDMALDAIEYAMTKDPRPDPRHRLEHVLFPTPETLERIKNLGVVVSTSPQWISMFGAQYRDQGASEVQMTRFMPLKEMLDKGIKLAFGCDVPATPLIEPIWALIGATSRWTLENEAIGQEQCISMKDAVRAHTMGSAYAAFEENVRGSIEVGKRADMVVWSEDLETASLKELWNTKAEVTIVEGKVIFTANDTDVLIPA
ncbi:MAG: amidohydrolase [Candidatus Methanospirareceae archaeon]